MNQLERTLTSLEIAEMVGRNHPDVLRDIRKIIEHLGGEESKIALVYFIPSNYVSENNQTRPCYKLTKKGCELYGTRMTGEKGTQFAVKYIERFNEMEEQQKVNFTMPQPTQAEIIAMIAQQGVEQERRIGAVEKKQEQLEAQQENLAEIIKLNPTEWRKNTTAILNKIAIARGGFGEYRNVRQESYDLLDARAKCKLDIRLRNRQREAMEQGLMPKSKIKNISKLDVIANDARLTEIYLAIVKEMAIAHKVNAEGLGA